MKRKYNNKSKFNSKNNLSNSENDNLDVSSSNKDKNKKDLKKDNSLLGYFKKFWNYIWHDDSLGSYIANFIFAFIVIKYLFFPTIGFVMNNDFPIVAIVSGSMEHKIVSENGRPYTICDKVFPDVKSTQSLNFDDYWHYCGNYYETNFDISKSEFGYFDYDNGLNIGDVMVLYGKDTKKIEIGEVLVFVPQDKNCGGESCFFTNYGPVIHRVVKIVEEDGKRYFQTKGDHNPLSQSNFEQRIPEEDVIGVPVLRVPFVGYVKLWLSKILMFLVKLI